MDNLTHSLVSACIGIAISRRNPQISRAIISAAILAGNFPDLDALYTPFISEPFGYLLHHRGHTHTLLGSLPCAIISFLIILFYAGLRKIKYTLPQKELLLLTAIVSSLAHILLDGLNTYGIHPYWPFSNNWVYGDTLFIIEPALWISLSLGIFAYTTKNYIKLISLALVLISFALMIVTKAVNPVIILLWLGYFTVLGLILRKLQTKSKFNLYYINSIVIIILFALCSKIAAINSQKLGSDNQVVSAVISPSPSNPFCWSKLTMERAGDQIIYSRVNFQIFENYFNLSCKDYSIYKEAAKYLSIPVSEFAAFENNCRWQAFLKFSRVPSIISCLAGKCSSDQRFSRRSNNFSEKPLAGSCPDLFLTGLLR